LNWIQAGGFARRIEAEEDTYGSREYNGSENRGGGNQNAPLQSFTNQKRDAGAEQNANRSTHDAQHHSFQQKLLLHVVFGGADRHAYTNLSRPLSDGNQHDVHDADTADDQRDTGNRCEQQGHDLGGLICELGNVREIADEEIIILTLANA